MSHITSATLWAVDLPFKHAFKHAAKARQTSSSIFLRLSTGEGVHGWGEALPRPYVTGETQDDAFELLHERVLPQLVGMEVASVEGVTEYLTQCDGKAPAAYVDAAIPQTAAWAAVDLALLDLAGQVEGRPTFVDPGVKPYWRHSGVVSSGSKKALAKGAALQRLLGLPQLKIKVDAETEASDLAVLRLAAPGAEIRVDSNMGWTLERALELMPAYAAEHVVSFEQPLPRDEIDGMAQLVAETGLQVMADESFSDRASLDTLLAKKACTAINVRVSKCGGFVASLARCREAATAGLLIQVGCQVGESSLLSAAQRYLLERVPDVRFVEGCFGQHLLEKDPVSPLMQFGFGGHPPKRPTGPGLGCAIDLDLIESSSSRKAEVGGESQGSGP